MLRIAVSQHFADLDHDSGCVDFCHSNLFICDQIQGLTFDPGNYDLQHVYHMLIVVVYEKPFSQTVLSNGAPRRHSTKGANLTSTTPTTSWLPTPPR